MSIQMDLLYWLCQYDVEQPDAQMVLNVRSPNPIWNRRKLTPAHLNHHNDSWFGEEAKKRRSTEIDYNNNKTETVNTWSEISLIHNHKLKKQEHNSIELFIDKLTRGHNYARLLDRLYSKSTEANLATHISTELSILLHQYRQVFTLTCQRLIVAEIHSDDTYWNCNGRDNLYVGWFCDSVEFVHQTVHQCQV